MGDKALNALIVTRRVIFAQGVKGYRQHVRIDASRHHPRLNLDETRFTSGFDAFSAIHYFAVIDQILKADLIEFVRRRYARQELRKGVVWLGAATSERFIPQMLGMDGDQWDPQILQGLGLEEGKLGRVIPPGTRLAPKG